jgi:hypothetical protein
MGSSVVIKSGVETRGRSPSKVCHVGFSVILVIMRRYARALWPEHSVQERDEAQDHCAAFRAIRGIAPNTLYSGRWMVLQFYLHIPIVKFGRNSRSFVLPKASEGAGLLVVSASTNFTNYSTSSQYHVMETTHVESAKLSQKPWCMHCMMTIVMQICSMRQQMKFFF